MILKKALYRLGKVCLPSSFESYYPKKAFYIYAPIANLYMTV